MSEPNHCHTRSARLWIAALAGGLALLALGAYLFHARILEPATLAFVAVLLALGWTTLLRMNERARLAEVTQNLMRLEESAARARIEDALTESEHRYRSLFESSQTPMLIIDPDSDAIVDANQAASQFYGWPHEVLVTMRSSQINTLSAEEINIEMARARSAELNHCHFKHRRADGEVREVEVYSGQIPLAGRRLLYSMVHDVSERRRSARRVQALLDIGKLIGTLPEREFLTHGLELAESLTDSAVGFLHFVNDDQNTIELVTWSAGTLQGCTAAYDSHYPISQAGIWADCLHQRRPVVFNDYPDIAGKQGLPAGHAPLQRLISVPVIVEGKVRMLLGVGNKASAYVAADVETLQLIGNDLWRIAHRRRLEAALQENERTFRTIFDANNDAIFMHDATTGRVIDVNATACRMYGYSHEELLKLDVAGLSTDIPPFTREAAQEYLRLARDRQPLAFDWRARDSAGREFWVRVNLQIVRIGDSPRIMAAVRDIDIRKQVEENLKAALTEARSLNQKLTEVQNQLLQAEKMASIGQLAAGVAHEINNPIGFVTSNLGSLENYLEDIFAVTAAYEKADSGPCADCAHLDAARTLRREKDYDFIKSDIAQLMTESKDGLARVANIVRDLRDFSRAGDAASHWADLHECLDATLNIVWNELKYKCTVSKDYGQLPPVWCVAAQLSQVFMNLLVNAAQAIPEKGEITIRSGRQGEEVFVAIADSGVGIAAENLNRIFDPFFTTKPVGKGTGLGLSLVYGIVQKHGGRIEVQSTVGKGSTFTVWLPINPSDAAR